MYLQIWMGGLGGGASNSVMGFALFDDLLGSVYQDAGQRWVVCGWWQVGKNLAPTYHLLPTTYRSIVFDAGEFGRAV
jgi:hypothetical protein